VRKNNDSKLMTIIIVI